MHVPQRRHATALAFTGLLALASALSVGAADSVEPQKHALADAGPASAATESIEAQTHAPADAGHCVNGSVLDLGRILPPPPAAGSVQERAELDELLRIQATRTPAQVDRAQKDATAGNIFVIFADALGNPRGFTPENLPLIENLFDDVNVNHHAVSGAGKRKFARPRPYTVESRLAPVIERPTSLSYPSGHAAWGYVAALVLADMVPEKRAQILSRADEFANNRAIAGVHYPSDVEAGRLAGTTLAAMLFRCQPFEKEEAAARAELRKALSLPQ